MDEIDDPIQQPPLRIDSVKGSIASAIKDGIIDTVRLKENLERKGAPASQIDYVFGVFGQIDNERLLEEENTKPDGQKDFDKIKHLTLALAGRLNLMVDYLASQNPNQRSESFRLADSIAHTKGYADKWKHIRRGLVSTIGFYLYYKGKYGDSVSLPTPEQDVDQAIDLIIGDTYVQLKAKKAAGEPLIFYDYQDLEAHTTTQISNMDETNPQSLSEIKRLSKDLKGFERLEQSASNQGKKAAFLIAPTSTFDSETAEMSGRHSLPDLEVILN